ncbi:hypothetical protein niasHT_013271 [Heterodera trifolii]|uniref:Uncharacterized protein n=1 Tax=Heterodera trifolii TaxID=157864 RepID=A0ABD2LAJ2_9BILA
MVKAAKGGRPCVIAAAAPAAWHKCRRRLLVPWSTDLLHSVGDCSRTKMPKFVAAFAVPTCSFDGNGCTVSVFDLYKLRLYDHVSLNRFFGLSLDGPNLLAVGRSKM